MSKEKPGLFRRIGAGLGTVFSVFRWVINLVFLVVFIAVIVSLLGDQVEPLPEKAPLVLSPSGILVEERSYSDPLTQLMGQGQRDPETPVRELTSVLDEARDDDRITALILNLDHLEGGGFTKLETLARAIESFKESGKPVIAVGDNYTQAQYYLASRADEIHLNPMGGVMITGMGYYGPYFGEALEKLRVNINVFRAGEYKSAVEPFIDNAMSEAARENARAWLDPLWQTYAGQVEEQRDLPAGTIDELANRLDERLAPLDGNLAQLAGKAGLVDEITPRPELNALLRERFGEDDDGFLHVPHKQYLAHLRLPGLDRTEGDARRIGLVVASGTILDGEQMEGAIGGDTLARLLRRAREEEGIEALVLRIDSPGGSATAAEIIREELAATREQMPVVVSMGSLAASGGYWIAAGADEIWAMPNTLTGSIGVFGIVPTFEDSLAALGIHNDGLGTNELADLNRVDRPLSPQASRVIQLSIDHIYNRFIRLVAEGRDLRPEVVEAAAGGRVWNGTQARERGLVDELGTLDEALAAAAQRAGLEDWQVKRIRRPLTFQEQLLRQLSSRGVSLGSDLLGPLAPGLAQQLRHTRHLTEGLAALNDPRHAYLQCFRCPVQP